MALSANTLEEEQQRCFAAGIDQVVSKPINSQQIDALLSDWQTPNKQQAVNVEQMIDFSILDQIFPDIHKQLEILTGFLAHIQTDYSALKDHAAQEGLAAVENTAHRMKGSSKMVGVNSIAELCEVIESNAKNGHIVDSNVLLSLNDSIQAFSQHLTALAKSNTASTKQGGAE